MTVFAVRPLSHSNLSGSGRHILIADDFPEWRIQIRKILSSRGEGQVISEASDGQEALQKAMELRPHIVLLDIAMPVMDGFEAAYRIRQHCPNTHIIFVTQTRDDDLMEAALRMGAAGYVLKVNAATELVAVIASAVANNGRSSAAADVADLPNPDAA